MLPSSIDSQDLNQAMQLLDPMFKSAYTPMSPAAPPQQGAPPPGMGGGPPPPGMMPPGGPPPPGMMPPGGAPPPGMGGGPPPPGMMPPGPALPPELAEVLTAMEEALVTTTQAVQGLQQQQAQHVQQLQASNQKVAALEAEVKQLGALLSSPDALGTMGAPQPGIPPQMQM